MCYCERRGHERAWDAVFHSPFALLLPELAPSTCACQYSHLWKKSRPVFIDPCRPDHATAGPLAKYTWQLVPRLQASSSLSFVVENRREQLAQSLIPAKCAVCFHGEATCCPRRLGLSAIVFPSAEVNWLSIQKLPLISVTQEKHTSVNCLVPSPPFALGMWSSTVSPVAEVMRMGMGKLLCQGPFVL